MRSTLARLLAGALVGAAAILATAPAAFAHGDPSSHSLEQDVLYPAVADRPTQETELALLGLLYAEYVVGELARSRPTSRPVLVLTPAGYGLAGAVAGPDGRVSLISRTEAADRVATLPAIGAGGEAMAKAAMGATRLLAAAAGHPLPESVPPVRPLRAASPSAADEGGLDWRLPVGVFLGVMLFAAAIYEVQRRFTAAGVPD